MRISSNLYYQTGLNSINQQQSRLMHVFQQVGTTKRMITPADDPLAAAQTITLSQAQSMNLRFAENRYAAQRNLAEEENVLNSLTTQMQDLKTRMIEAANGTLSDADRATLADVLRNSRDSLLGLANATDASGQYLFSGSKGDTAPYVLNGNTVSFQGDRNERLVQVDQTRRMSTSDTGFDVFSRATPGVQRFTTEAASGNTGTGVIGKPTITDAQASKNVMNVKLTVTNDSDPEAIQYKLEITQLDANGAVVTLPAAGDPDITGTYNSTAKDGNTIHVKDGSGNALGLSFDLSGVPANGNSFEMKRAASSNMGDETNGYPQSDLNLFDTLDSLIKALEVPTSSNSAANANLRNQLNTAIQRVDLNYDNVLTVRASVGARMNELDALSASGQLQSLHLSSEMSRLEDLDYYAASTELELRKNALQASALAFQKIQSTSLFSLLAGR